MRFTNKNTILIILLIILVILLLISIFFEIGIGKRFQYLIVVGIISIAGLLLQGILPKEKNKKQKSLLDLPKSNLHESPQIAFNDSLNIINKQLKTIQPAFKHAIYLIDPESNSFTLQNTSVNNFTSSVSTKNKIIRKIFDEEQTLLVKSTEYQDDWTDILLEAEQNISSCLLGVKINYNKSPIGILFALVNDVRKIESNDQILLKQFAEQITFSLSIIDNIESLQKHHSVLEKINSLVHSIKITENKTVIYENVSKVCQSIFEYNKMTIMVSYQDIDHARIDYIDGYTLDISRNEVFSLKNSIFANVLKKGHLINSKNIKKDFSKLHRFYVDEQTKRSITSLLAMPILIDDYVGGCIAIERFEEKKYSEVSKFYLERIAHLLSILLRWQSEYHKMYLNTTHDNLTGLLNYRAFLQRLDIELNRAMRNNKSLVIMVVDVDKFKRINDTFGHEIGNVALREITAIIADSVRNIDVLARYGGEEFIIAVYNADANKAKQIAERIVKNVGNNPFMFNDQRIKITVSAGMAEYPKDTDQVQNLIDAADKAMFRAKNLGGNTYSL